jgi:hypothetical protein
LSASIPGTHCDVEHPEWRFQTEVASLREVIRAGGIERKLRGVKTVLADAELTDTDVGEPSRKARQVGCVWRGADVDVLRRADDAVCVHGQAADEDVLHAGCP